MVCAYLRSCYTTTARLIAGRPDLEQVIRWYWADPAAELLPHVSAVTPAGWMPDEDPDPPIGEIPGRARHWSNGKLIGRPAGRDFHGEADWYVDGSPEGETLERSPEGPPVGCGVDLVASGGAQVGGEADLIPDEPPIPSMCCRDGGMPRVFTMRVTEATGDGLLLGSSLTFRAEVAADVDQWQADKPAGFGSSQMWSVGITCPHHPTNSTLGGSQLSGAWQMPGGSRRQIGGITSVDVSCHPFRLDYGGNVIDPDAPEGSEPTGTFRIVYP